MDPDPALDRHRNLNEWCLDHDPKDFVKIRLLTFWVI